MEKEIVDKVIEVVLLLSHVLQEPGLTMACVRCSWLGQRPRFALIGLLASS